VNKNGSSKGAKLTMIFMEKPLRGGGSEHGAP
jgi:hypothetical protein